MHLHKNSKVLTFVLSINSLKQLDMKNLISFEDVLKCTRRAIEMHYPFNHVLEQWDTIRSHSIWNKRYKNIITDPLKLAFLLRAIEVGDGKENIIVLTAITLALDFDTNTN